MAFNVNVSIRENGYENDYTTVGKPLKSYINPADQTSVK